MSAKGYATVADVAGYMGKTFTTAQKTQAALMIEAVETFIDGECKRAWLVGPVIGEDSYAPFSVNPPTARLSSPAGYVPMGVDLRTLNTPIDSVQAVRGFWWWDATPIPLILNTDYEVRSLATGLIRIIYPMQWYRLQVDYIPTNIVPRDIWLATVQLSALWMQPSLMSGSLGIDSYQLPDLKITFSKTVQTMGVPASAQILLDNYRFRTVK